MGTFNINNLLGGNVMGDLSKLGQGDAQVKLSAALNAVPGGFGEKLVKLIEAGEYGKAAARDAVNANRDRDAGGAGVDIVDNINSIIADALEGQNALLDGLNAIDAIDTDADGSDAAKDSFVNALTFEERLRMGNELIAYAFKKIAGLLDAPEEELPQSLTVEFSVGDADQFAAIMMYLDVTVKMITEMGPAAFAENMGQDFGAGALAEIVAPWDSAALTEFANGLRKEKFHLEMAFRLIGVHEMISGMAAEKSHQGVATGIPQAANPADLGMTTSDLAHAFGSLIREELTSAMERVRMITSGQAEMTDLEKAAVQLGTVNSEILKAALNGAGAPDSSVFENINLGTAKPESAENVNTDVNAEVKAGVNTEVKADNAKADAGINANGDTEVKADVNDVNNAGVSAEANAKSTAKKAADGFELPFSARELTGGKTRDRAEAANRKAFESVNASGQAKTSAVNDVVIPVSAKESLKKSAADNGVHVEKKVTGNVNTEAQVKSVSNDSIEIPVSAKESLKKGVVDNGVHVEKKVFGNVNTEAQVKGVSNDNVEIPVSAKESVKKIAVDNSVHVEKKVTSNVNTESQVKGVSNDNVEIPVSVKEPVKKSVVDNGVHVGKKVFGNVNTEAQVKNVSNDDVVIPVSAKESVKKSVVDNSVHVEKKITGNVNTEAQVKNVSNDNVDIPVSAKESVRKSAVDGGVHAEKKVTDDVNTAVKANGLHKEPVNRSAVDSGVSVDKKVADSVNTAVKADAADGGVSVDKKVSDNVNTAVKAGDLPDDDADIDADVENAPVNTVKESINRKVSENNDFAAKASNPSADDVEVAARVAEHVVSNKSNDSKKSSDNAKSTANKAAANTDKSAGNVNATAGNRQETLAQNDFAVKAKRNADTGDSANTAKPNGNAKTDNTGDGKPSINNNLVFSGLENSAVESEVSADSGESFSSAEAAGPKPAASVEYTEKAAAAPSRFDGEAVIRQIAERMQHAVRNGAHEVRMTLRPEALGEVRMSIRVEGDVVMARMQVENRQVKAIVESHLQSLKDTLEKHNMQFGAVSIDVGTDADSDRSPRQAWQELAEAAERSGARRFRESGAAGGSADGEEIDPVSGARGSDTGRRFGNNTFEYFI